ncbi:g6191 [Coccomyxa elongata]
MEAQQGSAKRKLPRSFLAPDTKESQRTKINGRARFGRFIRGRGGQKSSAVLSVASSPAPHASSAHQQLDASSMAAVAAPNIADRSGAMAASSQAENCSNTPVIDPEAPRIRKLPSTFAAASNAGQEGAKLLGNAPRHTVPNPRSQADTKAALRAALQGLELCGTDERYPPEGSMTLALMRHQRLALDWMLRREAGSAVPTGGILADDQGLGKSVTTVALILSAPAPNMVYATSAGISHSDSSSSESVSAQSSTSGRTEEGTPGCTADSATSNAQTDEDEGGDERLEDSIAARNPWEKGSFRGGTLIVVPTSVLHQWYQEIRDKVASSVGLRTHVYHGRSKAWTGQELAKYSVVLTTYTTMALEGPARASMKKGGNTRKAGPLFEVDWHRVVLDEAQAIKNAHTLASHASRCLKTSRRWCLSGTPIQNSVDDLFSYFRFLRYEPYSRHAAFKSMLREPLQCDPNHGSKLLRAALQGVLLRRTKASRLDGKPLVELPERQVELVRLRFSASERAAYDELQRSSMAQIKAFKGAGANYMNMLLLLLRLRQACNHPWLVLGRNREAPLKDTEVSTVAQLEQPLQSALLSVLHQPDSSACCVCRDIAEEPVMTTCCHTFCRQCLASQVCIWSQAEGDQSDECPACSATITAAQVFSHAALLAAEAGSVQSGFENGKAETGHASAPRGGMPASSKIERLLCLLSELGIGNVATATGVATNVDVEMPAKVLVFSQWRRMLDLIQSALQARHIRFSRLDGTMGVSARAHAIAHFTANRGTNVLLVSLKAASLGLNLTAANHVVLMDLWWNPSVEEQAIDRAHRIGQARTVRVVRLTIADTVEDRILALQEKKRKLAEAALGDGDTGVQASRLTMEDLHFLFSAD